MHLYADEILKEDGIKYLQGGDEHEYRIGKFASGAGKKAGEFYTLQEVSIVLSKIVTTGKKKLRLEVIVEKTKLTF